MPHAGPALRRVGVAGLQHVSLADCPSLPCPRSLACNSIACGSLACHPGGPGGPGELSAQWEEYDPYGYDPYGSTYE